jgi:hypothetical protein
MLASSQAKHGREEDSRVNQMPIKYEHRTTSSTFPCPSTISYSTISQILAGMTEQLVQITVLVECLQ